MQTLRLIRTRAFLPLCAAGLLACGADAPPRGRQLESGAGADADADAGAAEAPAARTFYVRADGDDGVDGRSPSRAWQSLARVNQDRLLPGDSVLLEAAATFRGTLRLDLEDSGSASAPVRIGVEGQGRARIEAGAGNAVEIRGASHVIVERLQLQGGWDAARQSGNEGEGVSVISEVSACGLRLRELEASGFKRAGIALRARPADDAKGQGYCDVEIRDAELHDNGDVGLVTDGPFATESRAYSHRDLRVIAVRAHHNRGLRGSRQHTGSGIVLADVDGARIERCVAHDNGEHNDTAPNGGFGIWAWDARRVLIQYNEAYGNRSQTRDGGGFDLDGGVTESLMQYNYSHDNHGAGFGVFQFAFARPYGDNRVRYNISQNDGTAFAAWDDNGDMGAVQLTHNVGYGDEPSVSTFSALRELTFHNNIFFGTGPLLLDVFDGRRLQLQSNVYWTGSAPLRMRWDSGTSRSQSFSDFATFQAATGQEASGSFVDPQLMAVGTAPTLDDASRLPTLTMYQLQPSSPLIDRGLTLDSAEASEQDFFGGAAPRGAAPDIGVHELR